MQLEQPLYAFYKEHFYGPSAHALPILRPKYQVDIAVANVWKYYKKVSS